MNDDLTDYEREVLAALLERAERQALKRNTNALAERFAIARRSVGYLT
jgi:hypothetical protein